MKLKNLITSGNGNENLLDRPLESHEIIALCLGLFDTLNNPYRY